MIVTRKRVIGTKVLGSLRYGHRRQGAYCAAEWALQPAARYGVAIARSTLSNFYFPVRKLSSGSCAPRCGKERRKSVA